ncbi:MAG: hypothetical protein K2Q18_03410 [Bdellovibrionales bacterium]|nr:hypothetical protein [Bdellovibrionales bacterium]
MHISEKIDLRKYAILSTILLAISYFLARDMGELKVMLTVFLAACLNQWMLVRGVQKITNVAAGKEDSDKSGLIMLFIGKVIVLLVAIVFGVQIMGKRIIIPVLIYVLQIVVLYLSMKKSEAEQGSNK